MHSPHGSVRLANSRLRSNDGHEEHRQNAPKIQSTERPAAAPVPRHEFQLREATPMQQMKSRHARGEPPDKAPQSEPETLPTGDDLLYSLSKISLGMSAFPE